MMHFFFYNFLAERGIKWYSSFIVAWRIRSMTIAFQLGVFALIATSSILLISVLLYLLLRWLVK
ncbi:hypothetical protein Scep_030958 [Stephania cephalantha]|uniref:Uncharacterized protein n=1 Tax=Stephania cephalantha TaxID=152367 RepID=A0AAP0E421_9MAGN